MSDHCANLKAKLEEMLGMGLSDKAKLVALLELCGVSDGAEIERLLECRPTTLRDARRALRRKSVTADASDEIPSVERRKSVTEATEIRQSDGNPARKSVDPSCAGATKESFQDTHTIKVISLPLPPQKPETSKAREGEVDCGHGVFLNCQTIRHADFTISLSGIEMNAQAAHKSKDEIRQFCLGHALQWGAEIEAGKRPDKVLPDRIGNFLAASLMGLSNRQQIQDVRVTKANAAGFQPKATAILSKMIVPSEERV